MCEHSLIVYYVEREGGLLCVILDGKPNGRKNVWNRTKNLHCLVKYWILPHRHAQAEPVCLELL